MNIEDINNSLKTAKAEVAAVKSIMTGFGVIQNGSIDINTILTSINSEISNWKNEVTDAIDFLAVKVGGNFVLTAITLLASIIGTKVLSWADAILSDFIFGNIVGGFYALISVVLDSIPGCELYLHYLSVKTLQENLLYRKRLLILLNQDINNIIELLQAYINLFNPSEKNDFSDIIKSIKAIKKAEQLLGFEISKIQTKNDVGINKTSIQEADNYVDKAINYLTPGNYIKTKNELINIKKKYDLSTTPPNSTNISDWVPYFTNLNKEIYNNYFTYKNTPGTAAYNKEKTINYNIYRQIVKELLLALPNLFKGLLLQEIFTSSSNNLLKKVPLEVYNLSAIEDVKKKLDDVLNNSIKTIIDYAGTSTNTNSQDSFYTDNKTKDLTVLNLNNIIKFYETNILALPTLWKSFGTVSKLYSTFIQTSLDKLKDIRLDMQNSLTIKSYDQLKLSLNKIKWASELTLAKATLKPIISSSAGIQGFVNANNSINAVELDDLILKGNARLQELKEFISYKLVDVRTNDSRIEPAQQAYQILQNALVPLLSNISILIFPQESKKLLANLQAVKILFNKQINLDNSEYGYCSRFTNAVSGHRAFPIIKGMYDALIKALDQTPLKFISKELLNGDVSSITNYFDIADITADVASLLVHGEEQPFFVQSILDNLSIGSVVNPSEKELKRIQKEVSTVMNTLKDKKDQLVIVYQAGLDKLSEVNDSGNTITSTTAADFSLLTNVNNNNTILTPIQQEVQSLIL